VAQEKLYLGFYSVINGLSLMIPGRIALKRTGANSVANEWIIDVTPPLTLVTVVEPGYRYHNVHVTWMAHDQWL